MMLTAYQEFISKTWNTQTKQNLHAGLLLRSEVGELIDAYKKKHGYGRVLDIENVIEELGDIFYGLNTLTRLKNFQFVNQLKQSDTFTITNELIKSRNNVDVNLFDESDEESIIGYFDSLHLSIIELCNCKYQLEYEGLLVNTFVLLNSLIKSIGLTNYNSIMSYNITKLSARYPDLKFNSEHSETRFDKILKQ